MQGAASTLLPNHPKSVERVVVAVLDCLAWRWRSLPRRTLVASWLLRTTSFAVRQERRILGTTETAALGSPTAAQVVLTRLTRFRPRLLDAMTLHWIAREPPQDANSTVTRRERRLQERAERGRVRLAKALRKRHLDGDPATLLGGLQAEPPPETKALILARWAAVPRRRERTDLAKAALRSWQWIGFKRFLRWAGTGVAMVLCVLLGAGLTLKWLVESGRLTSFIIWHQSQQLAKGMPEIAQPARPWPQAGDVGSAVQSGPRTADELFSLTNIWSAKLSFTAEQWKQLQPSRTAPSNIRGPDGQMALRNPNARRSGLAGVLGIEFNWVQAQLDFAGARFPIVAVRYRGNGTYVNSLFGPKQSFKVDLNKFTKGQHLVGVHTLNFVNAIPDVSYLHDALAERLFRDMGVVAPRTGYAYLTIDVPGRFTNQALGLYVLVENPDGDFAKDRFGSKKIPIFKPVTTELFKDLGPDWNAYAAIYDLKTEATAEQRARLIEFARLVTHAAPAEFARRLPEYLDLESFAGFVAGHVLLSSYDGFLSNGQNFYLYLDPRSNQFGFIPWDQDHSWGEFGYVGSADKRERASIWQPSTYPNRFLDRVMEVDQFQAAYRRHLEQALAHLFTVERLYRQIDEVSAVIRPAIAAESDFRLHRFDLAVSTNWLAGPRDGVPEGPRAPVPQLKRFISNRVQSVRAQLDGTAEGVVFNRRRK